MTALVEAPTVVPSEERGLAAWVTATDHKRIALMTLGTALLLFLAAGLVALVMRAQLAQPNQHLVPTQTYNQLFTLHGSVMIYLFVTPVAIAMGLYLVPLQVGAPMVAAPKLCLASFWVYLAGSVSLLFSMIPATGGASAGWYAYTPLSDSQYSPGVGMDLWLLGVFLAVLAMMAMAGAVLWTALRMRAPGMTLLRMPVFTWSMVVTCLMTVASFPSLLAAVGLVATGRADPTLFHHNLWDVAYQNLFWFYGHPVVYIMFFPFVGAVAEVLATFARRRFVGYKPTVLSLLAFAALSMSVWGHHLFTTHQSVNDYFSLTSTLLSVPAGLEYFGFLATLIGGRLSFPTPMLFALAFIPQFLIGGLTGIMLAAPTLDYHFHGTYFVVAHFHYTLFAGSVFGLLAGFYFWFPKATGVLLSERLGRLHFWLMVIGTNVTFLPMFGMGFLGMPRRVASYSALPGLGTLNLISSCGAAVLAISVLVLLVNVSESLRRRTPAPPDPWGGFTLEWATSSPPPRFNFDRSFPIPRIRSYAPLLDLRDEQASASPGR
ncbi:MAG: cbb3-type cytochrome c oxidase subunit I [Acidimicrobiales bacterium]|nr:cbb3-type cytochrome c oxidase subunit I [Acidimicrobiales bacterium]MBO0892792.1 cbb3-type cytochrome c oxidase subunit I [Acidimicrobiales bacterium]